MGKEREINQPVTQRVENGILEESRPFRLKIRSGLGTLGGYLLKISTAIAMVTGIILVFDSQTVDIEAMSVSVLRHDLLPVFKYSVFGIGSGGILVAMCGSSEEEP